MPSHLLSLDQPVSSLLTNQSTGVTITRINTALVERVRYAEIILSATHLSAEDGTNRIASLSKGDPHTWAAYSSFECTTIVTSLNFAFPYPLILGISQAKLARYWIASVFAIWRCSPKLILRSTRLFVRLVQSSNTQRISCL